MSINGMAFELVSNGKEVSLHCDLKINLFHVHISLQNHNAIFTLNVYHLLN